MTNKQTSENSPPEQKKLTKNEQIQAIRSAMVLLQEQVEVKIKYVPSVMQAMSNLEQVIISLDS